VKRKPLKKKADGGHVDRNVQFKRIAELKTSYAVDGNPVVSVDTKKTDRIGNTRLLLIKSRLFSGGHYIASI